MEVRLKHTLILSLALVSVGANAETIWCKTFKVGCPSAEEKAKKASNCQRLANETYQTALLDAIGNPEVWQLAGYTSSEHYASARKSAMLAQYMN